MPVAACARLSTSANARSSLGVPASRPPQSQMAMKSGQSWGSAAMRSAKSGLGCIRRASSRVDGVELIGQHAHERLGQDRGLAIAGAEDADLVVNGRLEGAHEE